MKKYTYVKLRIAQYQGWERTKKVEQALLATDLKVNVCTPTNIFCTSNCTAKNQNIGLPA